MPKIVVHDDPLSPEEHLKLGMAYEAKEPERAVEEYLLAARKVPLAHLYLGNTYYALGKLAEAEEQYRTALSLLPENSEVMNNLAWVLCKRNRSLDEALALARRAVELAPQNKAYADTLAAVRKAYLGK